MQESWKFQKKKSCARFWPYNSLILKGYPDNEYLQTMKLQTLQKFAQKLFDLWETFFYGLYTFQLTGRDLHYISSDRGNTAVSPV